MTETAPRLNVLFVCSKNQWRSATAERLWSKSEQLNVRSAGTSSSARRRVTEGDLEWADAVLVMEPRHREILQKRFPEAARHTRIDVLDIGDDYVFMTEDLVKLLRERVRNVLGDVVD